MTDETLLILDTGGMAWRGLFTSQVPEYRYDMVKTSMFGALSQVLELYRLHRPCRFAFAFDRGVNKRLAVFPAYKAGREEKAKADPDAAARRAAVRTALERLRDKVLPGMRFANVLHADGYEADDVIARCVLHADDFRKTLIVSDDQDMFQLIRYNVGVYMPRCRRVMYPADFRRAYGIEPEQWWRVKAIGGCKTDEVPGVMISQTRRAGEGTALSYLKEKCPAAARNAIDAQRDTTVARNERLVRLPFHGCPLVQEIKADGVAGTHWDRECNRAGLSFLAGRWGNRRG